MAGGGAKSAALGLLVLNLVLYAIVAIIAGWTINYSVEHILQTVASWSIPARIFPIHYPIGNVATAFFVMFSLIAALVGIATSVAGVGNVQKWNVSNLHSAATYSIITWSLTLLAMGLACKEINIGTEDSRLRALEVLIIILSGTQLLCMGAINAGVSTVNSGRGY